MHSPQQQGSGSSSKVFCCCWRSQDHWTNLTLPICRLAHSTKMHKSWHMNLNTGKHSTIDLVVLQLLQNCTCPGKSMQSLTSNFPQEQRSQIRERAAPNWNKAVPSICHVENFTTRSPREIFHIAFPRVLNSFRWWNFILKVKKIASLKGSISNANEVKFNFHILFERHWVHWSRWNAKECNPIHCCCHVSFVSATSGKQFQQD